MIDIYHNLFKGSETRTESVFPATSHELSIYKPHEIIREPDFASSMFYYAAMTISPTPRHKGEIGPHRQHQIPLSSPIPQCSSFLPALSHSRRPQQSGFPFINKHISIHFNHLPLLKRLPSNQHRNACNQLSRFRAASRKPDTPLGLKQNIERVYTCMFRKCYFQNLN